MKLLGTILALLIPIVTAYAQQNESLLACLGREELSLHQAKDTGPNYRLNQIFINKFSSLQNLELKKAAFKQVCQERGTFPPSVKLMKKLLIDGAKIFDLSPIPEESQSFREMRLSAIGELESETVHIFFDYLAQLQLQTHYAHCLKTHIPELSRLMMNYRYLEEDIGSQSLALNRSEINAIFSKLENFEQLKDACLKRARELDRQRNLNTNP